MLINKNWYAVHTQESMEKKVAAQLFRRKVETYLPLNKIVRKGWDGSSSVIESVLFPSMVFILAAPHEIEVIKQTDGVIGFIHWRSNLAIISHENIRSIKEFAHEHSYMWIEKCNVIPGHNVTATVQAGTDKRIYKVNNRPIDRIFLCSLGYNLIGFVREHSAAPLQHAIK